MNVRRPSKLISTPNSKLKPPGQVDPAKKLPILYQLPLTMFLMTTRIPSTPTTKIQPPIPPKTLSLQIRNHLILSLLSHRLNQIRLLHVNFQSIMFPAGILAPATVTICRSLPLLHASHSNPTLKKTCCSGSSEFLPSLGG